MNGFSGDRLKELRLRKGLSQRAVPGVGQDTISALESGRRAPRPSTLQKLSKALGVDVEEFFDVPKAAAPSESGPPKRETLPDFKDFLQQEAGSFYIALPHELVRQLWEQADTKATRWRLYEQIRREHAAVVKLADEKRDQLGDVQRHKLEDIWLRQANTRWHEANQRVAQKTDA